VEIRSIAADGVTAKVNGNVTKYPWTWLAPTERPRLEQVAAERKRASVEAETLDGMAVQATVAPKIFHEKWTMCRIQVFVKKPTGEFENQGLNRIPKFRWDEEGDEIWGVLDEPMPKGVDGKSLTAETIYRIGHTDDSSRDALFTRSRERALQFLKGELPAKRE